MQFLCFQILRRVNAEAITFTQTDQQIIKQPNLHSYSLGQLTMLHTNPCNLYTVSVISSVLKEGKASPFKMILLETVVILSP